MCICGNFYENLSTKCIDTASRIMLTDNGRTDRKQRLCSLLLVAEA